MPQILESANLFGLFIHRYGCDWIMLMFGGSVFSLVIVDVPEESRDFFFTFYCGVFTVVLLCFLHFHTIVSLMILIVTHYAAVRMPGLPGLTWGVCTLLRWCVWSTLPARRKTFVVWPQ